TGSFQTLFPTFGTVNSVLGINNLPDELAGFAVYPNPASYMLHVTVYDVQQNHNDVIVMYNMLGQKIDAVPVPNCEELIISTARLTDGVYFLKLKNNVHKVVVAR
ncbi:MAG TPA: T9SS type A sorting domain-containing protein, partial [Flavobacteriales bacterium]|nr:T9SS type A sorting domain-containing protein [Flavobacteriales bacterium]